MCYVIAKKFSESGCYAWETEHGKKLVELKRYLNSMIDRNKEVEIVTISSPEGYGEYAPYHMVETEEEFKKKVLEM